MVPGGLSPSWRPARCGPLATVRAVTGPRRVRREAQRLIAAGDARAAVDLLQAAVVRRPDRRLERLAVVARHQAFHQMGDASGADPACDWPPVHDGRFSGCGGVPEVHLTQFDAAALRAGVFGQGSLIVREAFDAATVQSLREAVRAAFRSYDRSDHGRSVRRRDDWLWPHALASTPEQRFDDRRWVRKAAGVLVADSPRALARLVHAADSAGITAVVREVFGERPALSVLKTTLRIVTPGRSVDHGWHQDGAFLGDGIRSMNMWVALSDCGDDAPTLQMVPRRLTGVLGSGGDGSAFSWSMSTREVEALAGPEGPQWLHFRAGDVVFFDHLNLHSTAVREGMTQDRLAIEAWFFAPSAFPYDRIPLLV